MPVIGKIRLGERKTSSGGKEYPSETEHFVLTDAPDVARVYGDKPISLDAFFISDDMDQVMPHWYKWYAGGVRDKEGNVIGGRLQCYGDGRVAHHLAKRDPLTRIVPERQCLGEKCPDWKTASGAPQCKPSMSVYVMLPRVSLFGLYQIDTTSKAAIQRFVSQVGMISKAWGKLRMIPFKIFREPTLMTFVDDKGKEQSRTHYILSIIPNEAEFQGKYGAELETKVQKLLSQATFATPVQERIEAPMEDNYAVIEDHSKPKMDEVAQDTDLTALFEKLCALKKKTLTPKLRLLTAKQFESSENPKSDLTKYLHEQIAILTPKAIAAPPPAQAVVQPLPNSDGLI